MLSKDKPPARLKKTGKVMKIPAGRIHLKRSASNKKRASAPNKTGAKRAELKSGRNAANSNKTLSRVAAVFFGFVFIYVMQSIITFAVKPHIAIDRIMSGSVTSPIDYAGVIIRDEKVYTSAASGSVRFNVAENARVKKDDVVCYIENADEVKRINAEMADVNEELLKVRSLSADGADVNQNERRVNLLMKNTLDDWSGRMQTNDFSLIYSLKDSLSANVGVRNQIIFSGSPGALKEQSDKRQMYLDELSKNMTPVKSEESGVVSTRIDGYEDTYTPNITAMLQKEQTTQKGAAAKRLTVQAAKPDTPLFKIIRSNIWYAASYLPNGLISDWKDNDAKLIYIDNYPGLPVTVDHITQKGNESYVLFKCTRFMEDFLTSRYIRFRVGSDTSEGLKIPQSAVIMKTLLCVPREYVSIEDDQKKTAKVAKSNNDKINISYIAVDDDMVYVDPINSVVKPGTELQSIIDAQKTLTLSETADISGVYRVNNGAADFRKIVLDTKTQNEGYYILEPDSNKNLQENDNIIHDASKVNEGDIIY